MARQLMLRELILIVCAASLGVLLSGCASTDELYAVYDEHQCQVEFVEQPATLASALPLPLDASPVETPIRALIGTSYFPWEPAVYFEYDSPQLDAENTALLAGAVDVLRRYPELIVGLQGFADRLGSVAYNQALAARRVIHVRDQLISMGVEARQLIAQPIGEGLPTFLDDDEKARAVNRRVELMLLDETGRPMHPLFDFETYGSTRNQLSTDETGVPAGSSPAATAADGS